MTLDDGVSSNRIKIDESIIIDKMHFCVYNVGSVGYISFGNRQYHSTIQNVDDDYKKLQQNSCTTFHVTTDSIFANSIICV